MENKSLQFLQKINSLPEEVFVYFSSNYNSLVCDEISEEYKIERETLDEIIYDFFIANFDIDLLSKEINTKLKDKKSSSNFINDFLGKLFLPVEPFINIEIEKNIKKYGGDIKKYNKNIQDFDSLIEEKNLDNLGDLLIDLEENFDENEEEGVVSNFLEKNLLEILKDDDPSGSQRINGSLVYLLKNKKGSLDKFTKAFSLNQELIGSQKISINNKNQDPSVSNWIKHFIKANGSEMFSTIALAKYLTSDKEVLSLKDDERKVLRKIIKIYRNLSFFPESMEGLPVESWEIIPVDKDLEKVIEKEREKFSLSVDKKKLAVEDQVETKNISPRGSKKIDSDDSWQFLQGMLKKYPEKSLEYKAIEDEIAKMKK
ncbi:MAG: hypothetical protein WC928_01565 [Patescibacteria group bacterium]|jgi:hypothetical protein